MRHFKPFSISEDIRSAALQIEPQALSIESISAAFKAGEFTPIEATAACLLRINAAEPYLNAFIWLNQKVQQDADRAAAEIKRGGQRSPLHGVPIVLKDNMNLVGSRTTAGYAGFASDSRVLDPAKGAFNGIDLYPTRDASLVKSLKDAGAILIGKSNLPDFGLDGLRAQSSYNGDTFNAYHPNFAPGASSSGSASAVASGMGVVGLGTDTAGSILFPASAQSLVGLKPTYELVATEGIYPGLFNHDVAGPIARTVKDVAAVLDVIAGQGSKAADISKSLVAGALQGKRIGVFEAGIWAAELHPSIRAHYASILEKVRSMGASLVQTVFGDTDWRERWISRTAFPQCNAYLDGVDEFFATLGNGCPASREEFEERAGFPIGLGTTAPLFALLANPAINVRRDSKEMSVVLQDARSLTERYEQIMADKQIDALLMPRSTQPLPNLNGNTPKYLGDQVVGTEVNELGLPVVTVPAGYSEDGRPVAIDIVGSKRFAEAEVLALAYDFEQATRFRTPPPEFGSATFA
jgi:amidase